MRSLYKFLTNIRHCVSCNTTTMAVRFLMGIPKNRGFIKRIGLLLFVGLIIGTAMIITWKKERLTFKHDARVFEVTSDTGLHRVTDINGRLKYKSQLRVLTTSTDSRILNTTYNNSIVKDSSVVTKVILLTYMRSGSSLTGEILQQHKDAFYLFEPLRGLTMIYEKEMPLIYMNGTQWRHNTYNRTEVVIAAIKGWLTCDFSIVPKHSLFDVNFLSYGHKTKAYVKCLKNSTMYVKHVYGIQKYNAAFRTTVRDKMHAECVLKLQGVCLASKVRIIKTIRVKMTDTIPILHEIPDSKIICLIRDPRATVESQRHRMTCPQKGGGLPGCIKRHCDAVWRDTIVKKSLLQEFPDRIQTVKYEDMSARPTETASKLYNYIGLEYNQTIQEYVYNITLGGNRAGCGVCQLKWQLGKKDHSSSLAHIDSWKTKLHSRYISIAQVFCKNVMQTYGYKYFEVNPVS